MRIALNMNGDRRLQDDGEDYTVESDPEGRLHGPRQFLHFYTERLATLGARPPLARRSPVTRSAHGSGMGPAWEYGFMDARRLAHMLA